MKISRVVFVFLLLAFPLFYFVYKYGNPEPLAHDFWQYYRLYKDWDINNVIAPHNMRLAGAFFVHLLYKANFFYDTETAFDKYYAWGFFKQVYFDAVFFNFLSVVATCTMLFYLLKSQVQNSLLAFGGGMLYLLGFGTIFYCLMPLTEAFSILLFTVVYYFYLKRSYWILVPLAVLVFQREYVFGALGLVALLDAFMLQRREGTKESQRYFLIIFGACVLFFFTYYVLRKTLFYTPNLDFQSQPSFMIENLLHPRVQWLSYFKQLLMTLNLFLIYMGIVIYKVIRSMEIDKMGLLNLILLFLQVNILSIAGGHDNNVGRYFYLLVPIVIVGLIKEVEPLVSVKSGVRSEI